jgi:hypothetical protein
VVERGSSGAKAHSGKSGYRQFGRRSEQLDPDQPQLGLEDLE